MHCQAGMQSLQTCSTTPVTMKKGLEHLAKPFSQPPLFNKIVVSFPLCFPQHFEGEVFNYIKQKLIEVFKHLEEQWFDAAFGFAIPIVRNISIYSTDE